MGRGAGRGRSKGKVRGVGRSYVTSEEDMERRAKYEAFREARRRRGEDSSGSDEDGSGSEEESGEEEEEGKGPQKTKDVTEALKGLKFDEKGDGEDKPSGGRRVSFNPQVQRRSVSDMPGSDEDDRMAPNTNREAGGARLKPSKREVAVPADAEQGADSGGEIDITRLNRRQRQEAEARKAKAEAEKKAAEQAKRDLERLAEAKRKREEAAKMKSEEEAKAAKEAEERMKAEAAASAAKGGGDEKLDVRDIKKMNGKQLKDALKERSLSTQGQKKELMDRLIEHETK